MLTKLKRVTYCFLLVYILLVVTVEVGSKHGGYTIRKGFSEPRVDQFTSNSRLRIKRQVRQVVSFKGDLCDEDSSSCEFLSEPQFLIYENVPVARPRYRQVLKRHRRPIYYLAQRNPAFRYPVPMKMARDVDAVDIMEHLFVKAMESTGMIKPKKKKYTVGKGNRPYVWNEGEENDFDADFDDDADPYPFSLYKPTGNIYHAGNKYYQGSHDNINLLKKYGVTKWKHPKYHLKPLVHFESPDDYDDLWEREYD